MGFKAPRKVYVLDWPEGHELHGLEVKAASLPLGTFMDEFGGAQGLVGRDPKTLTAAERARGWSVVTTFAGVLRSWNLEDDDDQPIPADLDGLKTQELGFAMSIIEAYMDAVGGVTGPLADSSTSGGNSLEASLPMAPLSASQAS